MSAGERVPIDAQSIDAPLSRSAVFLVLAVGDDDEALATVRDVLGSLDDLIKNVGFRDLGGRLSCIAAIGSRLWDRLSPRVRPAELHEFVPITAGRHTAPSTPGDLLLHIRAERHDLCFELERMILDTLGAAVSVVDEIDGFRYFDQRDLLGFVDGTANPVHEELSEAALVGDDDPSFAGGSYVVLQKYLHDLTAWGALGTEEQQRIIGRTKLDNVELDDDPEHPAHKTLATIDDGAGGEFDILRDNMPFGRPGRGEFGTCFIGYSGRLWVTERMLQRMFVGEPPGAYDRILDFSTAVTGGVFFAPTRGQLGALSDGPLPAPPAAGGAA